MYLRQQYFGDSTSSFNCQNMKKVFLLPIFLLFALAVQAQSEKVIPPINADRPGYGVATDVVPDGLWQIETGLTFQNVGPGSFNFLPYTFEVRYGFKNFAEVLAYTGYEPIGGGNGLNATGVTPLNIGGKVKIAHDKWIFQDVLFHGTVSIPPIATGPYNNGKAVGDLRIVALTLLPNNFSVNADLGLLLTSGKALGQYSVQGSYQVNERSSAFVELYGYDQINAKMTNYLNAGYTFLRNKRFQWDASFGFDFFKKNYNYFFVSGGLSYRWPK